ncbi:MAG: toll/interleukin-1 receptor domain-containing protein [Deltaproteobacteria bacterium]|nr:toll/interleukin-1 receptor domain-containing protein [Deltaproteobacteria bacterium]
MADVSIHKRKFHTFLSHAHADKVVVDHLYDWLSNTSGIPVWYDARHLPAGATIATHLATAVTQCRSLILVLSPSSIKSGWVKEEYETAISQRTRWKDFRIIPLRIEECEVPGFLQTTKWIDILHGQGDAKTYGQFLADLYYDEVDLEFEKTRDIYVSRSWKESERPLADAICQRLMQVGFRLIGDAQDQAQFSEERITSLLASCGGAVAILPDRGQGKTSAYILQDLRLRTTSIILGI